MVKNSEHSIASDRESSPRRSHRIAADVLKLAISAGILAASVGVYLWLGEPEAPARKRPPKPTGVAVKTTPAQLYRGPVSITTNGVVVPYREISIAAEVSGRIVEQSPNLRAGRRVKKGEPLIRIDPAEFGLEVRRLETAERQAKAELAALEVTVENTQQLLALSEEELALQRAEMKRIQRLQENDATSTAEIEVAKRAELLARAAVVRIENSLRDASANRTLLEEKLKLTGVELERAQLDEQRTLVTSPVDGRVAMCMVEEQAYVTSGQAFARIEDVSAMEVRTNLTMDEMQWLWIHRGAAEEAEGAAKLTDKRGSMAAALLAAAPISAVIRCSIGGREYEWDATFRRVDGSGIDDTTRTVPCLFRVDQPDLPWQTRQRENSPQDSQSSHALMRGMFVTVAIETMADRDLFRVPNESIRPGKRIWLNDNGKLRVAAVSVVSRSKGATVIESHEIAVGQPVITSPVPGARQGLAVMVGGGKPSGAGRGPRPGTPGTRPGSRRPGNVARRPSDGPAQRADDSNNPDAGKSPEDRTESTEDKQSKDKQRSRTGASAGRVSEEREVGS